MKKVSDADKLYYFEKNFFTIDGVWMLEVEKEVGWEIALKIDKNVWIRLMKIIFKRIQQYLNIKANTLNNLIELVTFRWSIEGWKYSVNYISDQEVIIEINECPYKAIMDRNPDRQSKIPLICKDFCIPFYKAVLEDLNSQVKIERSKFMGLGDNICDFHFKQISIQALEVNFHKSY